MYDAEMIAIPGSGSCPHPPHRDTAIRRLAEPVHRLNHAVSVAVQAGATVELHRVSRIHDGAGHWGDQLVPVVKVPD